MKYLSFNFIREKKVNKIKVIQVCQPNSFVSLQLQPSSRRQQSQRCEKRWLANYIAKLKSALRLISEHQSQAIVSFYATYTCNFMTTYKLVDAVDYRVPFHVDGFDFNERKKFQMEIKKCATLSWTGDEASGNKRDEQKKKKKKMQGESATMSYEKLIKFLQPSVGHLQKSITGPLMKRTKKETEKSVEERSGLIRGGHFVVSLRVKLCYDKWNCFISLFLCCVLSRFGYFVSLFFIATCVVSFFNSSPVNPTEWPRYPEPLSDHETFSEREFPNYTGKSECPHHAKLFVPDKQLCFQRFKRELFDAKVRAHCRVLQTLVLTVIALVLWTRKSLITFFLNDLYLIFLFMANLIYAIFWPYLTYF